MSSEGFAVMFTWWLPMMTLTKGPLSAQTLQTMPNLLLPAYSPSHLLFFTLEALACVAGTLRFLL